MNTPTVSAIIPTYNRADLLGEAVDTVFQQTYPISDIVIADDGSTDNTADLVSRLQRHDARITFISGRHEGRLGPLRNRAVAASRGELLAFLDSDDLWLPARVERQVAALAHLPGAAAGFCNVQRFSSSGLWPSGPWLPPAADYSGRILGSLFLEPIITASSLMVRRYLFLRLGGFAGGYNAVEYEFSLRLAAATRVAYVPEPLALIRTHDRQVSTSHGPRPMLEHLAIILKFLRRARGLTLQERWLARKGMANVHYKLASFYLDRGEPPRARRHLLAQARLRPWERRIWLLLPRTLGKQG